MTALDGERAAPHQRATSSARGSTEGGPGARRRDAYTTLTTLTTLVNGTCNSLTSPIPGVVNLVVLAGSSPLISGEAG